MKNKKPKKKKNKKNRERKSRETIEVWGVDLPQFLASSADIGSPVKIISMARDFPTARGRRWVPPAPKVKKKMKKKIRKT